MAAAIALAALGFTVTAFALPNPDAVALRGKHDILRDALATSPFERPLFLRSTELDDELKGDVYAVIEQPFAVTARALKDKAHWCDLLMLHLNVKRCRAGSEAPGETLSIVIGRKHTQSVEDGYRMEFNFSVPAVEGDYLRVQMAADAGPMYTGNYRLVLEAVPLTAGSSFMHMSYAYSYGTAARLATKAYLSTTGRDKVGFTVTGQTPQGKPVYINGVRGMIERNAMRYYLAVEAYLASLSAPPAEQQEKRLRDWYAATERSAIQLHEMERDDYLAMKRREVSQLR
jgi:hypothetical protein